MSSTAVDRLDADRARGLRALVVGDGVLDRWVHARPTRLSREAPVPVFSEQRVELRPGGAANVAWNLARLGAATAWIGAVGADRHGRALLERMRSAGCDTSGARPCAGWSTPLKTRVLAAEPHRTPAQVLRLDRDPTSSPAPSDLHRLVLALEQAVGEVDLVVVSDYGYGVVGEYLGPSLEWLANCGTVCVLDPRRFDFHPRGLRALTPNLDDLARTTGRHPDELAEPHALEQAARRLLERSGARWLLATLGNRGMALFGADGERASVPAAGSERVVDVSGAGDTAAAVFGLALAAGTRAEVAMELANAAAGRVVMELGTAAIDLPTLLEAHTLAPRARTGVAIA